MSRPTSHSRLALSVVAVLVAACSGGPASSQAPGASVTASLSGGTITIGAVGPLSQPGYVAGGLDMKWAAQTAADDINAQGGVLGKKVVIDFEDTADTPATASAIAKKFVDEKVAAVTGEYHSAAALAMIPVLEPAGVPTVFADTVVDSITGGDPSAGLPANPPDIFRLAPPLTVFQTIIMDWLQHGVQAKHLLEFYEASDYGRGTHDTLAKLTQAAGIGFNGVEVQLNQPDYSAVIARAKQDHPDTDAVIFDLSSAYVIEENALQGGLFSNGAKCVVDDSAQASAAYWKTVPDGFGCVFRHIGPLPAEYNDLTKSVAQKYQAKFNATPNNWVYEAYDCVRLVADAMVRAGSTDYAAVNKALETTSFLGAQGTYSFPYNSTTPVPSGTPSYMWHQWPSPPLQMLEYTKKDQTISDAAIVWPPAAQSQPGTAYIPVTR